MIVSILFKVLLSTQNDLGKLPSVLHLSMDNCFRENKNRFVLSFLAALVELDILAEVNVTFLLVGHTGNEVDQLFSILTQSFKKEIKTLEDLKDKIVKSGIKPVPDVEVLEYIWNWKMFALDALTEEELRNHSKYHAFNIKKEKGQVKLRGKRYLFDDEWVPYTGIRLLKEGTDFPLVDPAEFRIKKLDLPKVFLHLQKYFSTLPLVERLGVQGSWDRLREKLEKLPSQADVLRKMNIHDLHSFDSIPQINLPHHFAHLGQDEIIPDLEGETFPEELNEADFEEDVKEGLDVLIYTRSKLGRPWLGRVLSKKDDFNFTIQWYEKRKGNQNNFYASKNADGSAYTSDLESGMVILWNFSTRIDDESFSVNCFFLNKFKEEYAVHDASLI